LEALGKSKFFQEYIKKATNEKLLKNIFLMYSKSNPNFMQLRYIDKNGFERIRVDKDYYGSKSYLVSNNKLQNKSNRYYFKISKQKELGKVWFSAIDLNVEKGKVEIPYKPTMRVVLPVSKNNQFEGILIINLFMKDFLQKLTDAPLYDMILFDDLGNIIIHYDDKDKIKNFHKSWSLSLKHNFNISNEFTDSFKNILKSKVLHTDSFVSRKLNVPINGGLNLILELKKSYLKKQEKSSQIQYTTTALVVFVLSIVLILVIVKIFGRKLLNLEEIETLNHSIEIASKIARIGFWEFNSDTKNITLSDGIYDVFEMEDKNKKLTYEDILSFIPENDRKKVQIEVKNSIKQKRDSFIIYKIITEKGNLKFVEERAKHYFDSKNKLIKSIGSIYDITSIQFSEQKFKALLDYASDGIHIIDENGKLILYSHSFANNLGYEYDEVSNLSIFEWDAMLPKEKIKELIKELIKAPKVFETKHIKKDGKIIDVQINAKNILLDGKIYLYASQRDITDVKKNEKLIIQQKVELETIFQTSLYGIGLLDLELKFKSVNAKYCEILGFSEKELLTKSCLELTDTTFLNEARNIYKKVLSDGCYENFERFCITKSGEKKRLKSSIALMPNKKQYLMTTTDNTELYHAMEKIKTQAYTDDLTNLLNRKSYNEKIEELLYQYKRYGITFSFLTFDIDFFKSINDSYGHKAGDDVLVKLSNVIKKINRFNDYIFRIGGEEFVILLVNTSLEQAVVFAEKLRISIQKDVDIITNREITVSIGLTEVIKNDTVDSIYKRADDNLYKAKNSGRNKIVYFNNDLIT
jgi:diguanylate cyclase (GGDEF)-like protein/PAS domain S-box-containing protein